MYTYVPSLLNLLPTSLPTPPHQMGTQFEFPESFSEVPLALYFTYGNVCFHITLSIHPTLSFLGHPSHVHKSVLYVCVSTAALQIISSVPSFQIPYICVSMIFVFLFLTSLCIIGSRFIHLIRTDSNVFLFMAG